MTSATSEAASADEVFEAVAVARYDFTTGSGEERFTGDRAVAGGAFTDRVGRHVS